MVLQDHGHGQDVDPTHLKVPVACLLSSTWFAPNHILHGVRSSTGSPCSKTPPTPPPEIQNISYRSKK